MEGTFGDLNLKGSRSLSAIDIASENGKLNIATLLLRRFKAHPEQIRREVRVKLGFPDELAAEVFALADFLCDGLLQLKPAPAKSRTKGAAALRFFTIIQRLPLELQMILCHRVADSCKDSILSKDSEVAFKCLARLAPSSLK